MKPLQFVVLALLGIFFSVLSFFYDPHIASISFTAPFFDHVLNMATQFSFILIVLFLLPGLWMWKKGQQYHSVLLLTTFLFSFTASLFLKLLIERPRPLPLPSTLIDATAFSFPSTHAMVSFSLLPLLILVLPQLRWLWIVSAVLTTGSRLYFGVHYLSDVVVGASLGLLLGLAILHTNLLKTIKEQSLFEVRRKLFHIGLGLFLVFLFSQGTNPLWLLPFLILGLIFSYLVKTRWIPVLSFLIELFERKEDKKTFPGKGIFYFLFGVFLTAMMVGDNLNILLAAILILTFGDSFSHLYGVHFGKVLHPLSNRKFFEGALMGFLAGFLSALLFVSTLQALLGSLAAMIIEAFDVRIGKLHLEDNVLIPVVSALVMIGISVLLG